MKKEASCKDSIDPGAMSVAEAVNNIVESTVTVSGFNHLHIRDGLHRTLYEDIRSPIDVPAHMNSAMDGYALASSDLPADNPKRFKLVGTAYAGDPYTGPCRKNECVRIMTGAIVPDDTNCIVIQEEADVIDDNTVEIGVGHRKNQNIRFAGEDVSRGSVVLSRGRKIKAADLGVLASLGLNEIKVYRKPRVSFFSTGDELKSLGEVLEKGDIYDSNRYSLYGLLADCQVDLIDMGVIRDDPEALRQALIAAANSSDMILTSGGVSVGEADYIKGILQEIGQMDFWKILMKPGRPLTYGKINDCIFLGLPGNPVAVMVTFYQFVLPCLRKLCGQPFKSPHSFRANALTPIRKNPGRAEFQRAIASMTEDGRLQVALTGKQGSGILTSMSQANCFIVLPEACGNVEVGDEVRVEYFEFYLNP